MANLLARFKPSKNRTPRPQSDNPDDDLGAPISQHRNPYNDTYTRRTSTKALSWAFGFAATLAIIEAVIISQLIPLKTIQPVILTFSDSRNQLVRVDLPTTHLSGMRLLLRNEIRQYMIARYTVTTDQAENNDRWNKQVRLYSTSAVYRDFQSDNANIVDLVNSNRITRSINIKSITSPTPNTFHIDFDLTEHIAGSGLSDTIDRTTQYTAEITISRLKTPLPAQIADVNPIGIVVSSFVVTHRQ